jgi:uncharacterized protein YndB with AHSA1/START domain
MSRMTLETEGGKHVVVTRRFAASPEAVYRAHTEPRLIQKWLLDPDGWTMPVCVDGRKGRRVPPDWRISGAGAFQQDRSRGEDAPARPDAGQPR